MAAGLAALRERTADGVFLGKDAVRGGEASATQDLGLAVATVESIPSVGLNSAPTATL